MVGGSLHTFLRQLRRDLGPEADANVSDVQLLQRFVSQRDETAFEVLVWRHAGLVLDVCNRGLLQGADTEDAFQATFLALARKGGSITNGQALRGWLARVASRVVQRLRARAAREVRTTPDGFDPPAPPEDDPVGLDVRRLVSDEVRRLPEKYRVPVVLCYLEGRTTQEAARQVGVPRGTICSRLSWARQQLRARLSRHGLALPLALLGAALLPRPASAELVRSTVRAATIFISGPAAARVLSGRAVALAEGVLRNMLLTRLSLTTAVVLLLGAFGVGVGWCQQGGPAEKAGPGEAPVWLPARGDAVRLPANHPLRTAVQTTEVPSRQAEPRVLCLSGSTILDPKFVHRVPCPFTPAEVVQVTDLAVGNRVRSGQLLAVVRSAEVGGKKVELLEALLQVSLDEKILEKAEQAPGALPEIFLLNARRNVLADQSAVTRLLTTLQTWNIPEKDLESVRAEADRVSKGGKRDPEREKKWGEMALLAPADGVLIERNVALNERVEDRSVALFQIARPDRLKVVVQASEADLPVLDALPPDLRRWTIRPGYPGTFPGRFDRVGPVVDPITHSALVMGDVDDPQGRLRPGLFITASIRLPQSVDEVVVPAAAVVEADGQNYVFVQTEANQPVYEQRRVTVVRRGADVVHVRSRLTPEQERQGLRALRPGERVVTARALELKTLLEDLKAGSK